MHYVLLTISSLLFTPSFATAENISLGNFAKNSFQGWEEKEFEGKTNYELVFDASKQQQVLKATSHGGASGLFLKQRIDLDKTPWLHWSWKSETLLRGIDENEKSGDDFVARIYVVIDGGFFFWKTLALNYVWSASHQTGESWSNPFTSNATMFAVQSGEKNLGLWSTFKRDVKKDLKNLMGKDVQYIDAIAIMTDTDNSKQNATSFFGDIFFTSE